MNAVEIVNSCKCRILAVDDEPSVLNVYRQILSPENDDTLTGLSSLFDEMELPPSHPHGQLENSFLDTADDGERAVELVRASVQNGHPYAVIFMDVRMPPNMDGVEAAEKIREIDDRVYIVFVTAYSDYSANEMHQKISQNMTLLTKPFVDDSLIQMARMLCVSWQRESCLKRSLSKLERQADVLQNQVIRDGLTGIYNRYYLNDTLEKEFLRAQREQQSIAILMIDIDYFKRYNDTYGHLKGDQVLHYIAQYLDNQFRRPVDFVARFGGEEFCAVLPNTDISGSKLLAERVCRGVEGLAIDFPESDISESVTVSIGGTCCVPTRTTVSASLLARADDLLYSAKEMGRNCSVVEHM